MGILKPVAEIGKELLLARLEFKVDQIRQRLADLGWLIDEEGNEMSLAEALHNFQLFHGLRPDAEAGERTLKALFRPAWGRCGLPDIQRSRGSICQWPMRNVPLATRVQLAQLTPEQVHNSFERACNAWNNVCGIRLSVTRSLSKAWIVADSGQGRGDYLDGPGGTLAWSELPCAERPRKLQQKYDISERWTEEFLTVVATHEIGHAIGLDHLSAGNLMQPTYDPNISTPQAGDIEEAITRYGKP